MAATQSSFQGLVEFNHVCVRERRAVAIAAGTRHLAGGPAETGLATTASGAVELTRGFRLANLAATAGRTIDFAVRVLAHVVRVVLGQQHRAISALTRASFAAWLEPGLRFDLPRHDPIFFNFNSKQRYVTWSNIFVHPRYIPSFH